MESLFLSLWNRSIAAGWLILAVILLRLVLQKTPKSIRPWLWAMAGIRLVWPRFGESSLSLLPSAETVPQASLDQDAFHIQSGLSMFNNAVNEQLVDYYETTNLPAGHTRSFVFLCAVVWVTGMVLIFLWALVSYLRLRRRVAEAVPEENGVWVCERVDSPFLLGLFRPRIYLPVGLDENSKKYVLAHERTHIRRRDHLIKPLGLLLLAVYWFQPMVWAAYILLCRDIELACDERVVLDLGEACKKPYSTALLECSIHRNMIAACPLAFGEVGVKERVKNVLNYKKPAFLVIAACVAVVIVVGVCFLTDPVEKPPKKEPPPEDNISFTNLGTSQPGEATTFVAGALLYQNMALSFQPIDGSPYNPVLYGGDTLTLTFGGLAIRYKLTDTVSMIWDNLYDYFPGLAEEEAYFGELLTDHNDLVITARFYERDLSDSASATDAPQTCPSVWTIQKKDGGQRWWLYDEHRLYALIDPNEAFPFLANGVLWTYEPNHSDILPVRFDIKGGANVFAGPNGLLSLDPRGEEWVAHLEVEEGQTVYWKPPLDEDGKPMANVGLRYYYDETLHYYDDSVELKDTIHKVDEILTIRPAMDYTGLYGGVTYGVSNNWMGGLSSATHFTCLTVDSETYDLVVCETASFPYEMRDPYGGAETVQGISGPVTFYDAPANAE